MRRVRSLIGNPELAFILPFCMTADEVQLAVGLELRIYGCDPALNWLGTKKGSRACSRRRGSRTRLDSRSMAGTSSREPSTSSADGAWPREEPS
jgi:hypothetical protein